MIVGTLSNLTSKALDIVEQRGEVAAGIYVQVIGDKLFVRDRRDQERESACVPRQGRWRLCAYEHRRAEDLGLFSGDNLVHNGSFRL